MKHLITAFGLMFASYAFAATDTTTNLLNVLCEKGTLSVEECEQFKQVRDQEISQQRADRRTNALKKAQDDEAKEKAKSTEVKGTIKDGGLTFETPDKKFSIAPTGRVQLDYRAYGNDAASITANTFDIRRAFLGFKGRFFGNYDWLIVGDFGSSGASVLDEAWLNVNYWNPVQLRVGQFKVPFSLEERTTDLYTDFMERSMGSAIVPGKERGMMIHGIPLTGTTYAVGLTTGQGKNNNDTVNSVDSNDVFVSGTINFSELFEWKNTVTHLGAGYTSGTIPSGAAISGRTEARGITFFTPSAFTGVETNRGRQNIEAAFAYGSIKVQGEMLDVNYSGTSAGNVAYNKNIASGYVDAMWFITGEKYSDFYKDGKFDRVKPLKNFDASTLSGGAWEVGIRFSQFDAGDFASGAVGTGVIPKPTSTAAFSTGASAMTVGLNFYPNARTRLMLNYVDTKFDSPVVVTQAASSPATGKANSEKAMMVRFQFDF